MKTLTMLTTEFDSIGRHVKNDFVARVNRRLRRYYLIVLLLPNIFTLARLLLSSIKYDTGHLMMV